jgi:hypothetical protein
MTEKASEDESGGRDYYLATLEEGALAMEPHCACGSHLLEKYHCERCNKQCLCTDVICDNETTLEFVNKLIVTNPKFRNFKAYKK